MLRRANAHCKHWNEEVFDKIHGQIVHELRKREAKGSYNTRWRPRGWHATPRAVQGAAQHLHVGLIVRPLIPAAEVVNVQAVHLLCPAHP